VQFLGEEKRFYTAWVIRDTLTARHQQLLTEGHSLGGRG
jgi:hypothetical protein